MHLGGILIRCCGLGGGNVFSFEGYSLYEVHIKLVVLIKFNAVHEYAADGYSTSASYLLV